MAADRDRSDRVQESDLPKSPTAPRNPFARDMATRTERSTPGIDKRIEGADDFMTPRDLAESSRGPISNVRGVNKEFEQDALSRPAKRRFSRDYSQRPLSLSGRR